MANEVFGQNLQNKVERRKSEQNHQILHIQNSLGTKFQVKVTIMNFWIKLTQKRYF